MLKGQRLFITGGAGFIGSNLAKRLIGQNEIAIFDNFTRNAAQHVLGDCVMNGHGSPLRVYQASILDFEALTAAVDDFQPTHVAHCAAIAGIDTVVKKPVDGSSQRWVATSAQHYRDRASRYRAELRSTE